MRKMIFNLQQLIVPGKENVTADYESRICNLDTEWMLNPKYLSQALEGIAFTPVIDLFASRALISNLTSMCPTDQIHLLATSMHLLISWADTNFY